VNQFTQLLEREIPRLRRYARTLTRDTARADDLVQSCLLRGLVKQHLWPPGLELRPWLFKMLHNLHVDDVRRSVREQDGAAAAAFVTAARSESGARLDLLDLDRAISQLPQTQRRVVQLVGLDGMRYDEAAAILQLPIGTIRSRLWRARAILRRLMDSEADNAISSPLHALRNGLAVRDAAQTSR